VNAVVCSFVFIVFLLPTGVEVVLVLIACDGVREREANAGIEFVASAVMAVTLRMAMR
jgi:hypothetical protein